MLQSKDTGGTMDKKIRPLHMLSTRDSLQIERQIQTKSKGVKKIFHENENKQKS